MNDVLGAVLVAAAERAGLERAKKVLTDSKNPLEVAVCACALNAALKAMAASGMVSIELLAKVEADYAAGMAESTKGGAP